MREKLSTVTKIVQAPTFREIIHANTIYKKIQHRPHLK